MSDAPPAQHDRIQIAPSILASDFLQLGDAVRTAVQGGADRLHLDVMDGRFVPNITIGPPIVEAIRGATDVMLEAHLMIIEPERYVPVFAEAGADLIIVHQEVSPHLYRTVQHIKRCGARAGVAINPGTPWIAVEEILPIVDLILVMTVNPGFGGQEFIDTMLRKIRHVRYAVDRLHLPVELEVDGGIDARTAPDAVRAGARVLVAGTSVYKSPQGIAPAIKTLRTAAQEALASS